MKNIFEKLFFTVLISLSVTFNIYSQCTTPNFSVNQVPVVTGTAGTVGAIYRRTNVSTGVDMQMEILSITGTATLVQEDDGAAGYLAAWQPVIRTNAGTGSGGMTWSIKFFKNGTSFATPYTFNCLSVLALNIDGEEITSMRKFVEVQSPYSYSGQSATTWITYSATSTGVRAEASATTSIVLIDSTRRHAEIQYNFKNISSFIYTTGFNKTTTSSIDKTFPLLFKATINFITPFVQYFNIDKDAATSIGEATDLDDDNDGIADTDEYPSTFAAPFEDADADNIPNYMDATPGTGVPTFTDTNTDGINDKYDPDLDGLVNSIDADSDNDGIPDITEAGGIDTNGDGVADNLTDTNVNGLPDTYDPASGGLSIRNLDTDLDAIPNAQDLDSDNDGLPDALEVGATDANNDGKRDSFTDIDGDGLADVIDGDVGNDGTAENTSMALIITSAAGSISGQPASYPKANTDGNGLPDVYDLDADNDGILDSREAEIKQDTNNDGVLNSGDTGFTDTNLNGWSDQVDALNLLLPVNSDGTGKPDYQDIDSDNDGITDNIEGQTTSAYTAPSGIDTDGDGVDNVYDNVNTLATFGGNANNGITPADLDTDGYPDFKDVDSDNDRKTDRLEGWDTNGNNKIDGSEINYIGISDLDGDGLLDEYDANDAASDPANGTTPASYPDINNPGNNRDWRQMQDTDSDGIVDVTDTDDDNDGIPDSVECPTCSTDVFQNGSFELPAFATATFNNSTVVPGWATTASDNFIEIWTNGYNGENAYGGSQFAEINATQAATLYQNFCLNGNGATIVWSVRHQGRSGVDVANVKLGSSVAALTTAVTMTDGTTAWGSYNGIVSVPPGITSYFIGLTAVSTSTGVTSVGNFVDDIQITIIQPCDADGDGIPNSQDLDSDGDGISDEVEGVTNTDGDGKPDYLDIDSDNDGISDNVEGQSSAGYLPPSGLDTDVDGIDNVYDNNDALFGGTAGNGLDPFNFDGTDLPDYLDTDADNDGIFDRSEGNDWNGNEITDENTTLSGIDTDGDGLDNIFDLVNGANVTIIGFGGTGSRATAKPTVAASAGISWRDKLIVLPVTLTSFTVNEQTGNANLQWTTENEVNFSRYLVERSTSSLNFSTVGTVSSFNDGKRNSYQFADNIRTISSSLVYYRLKMIDLDGKFKYSSMVSLQKIGVSKKSVLVIYNPIKIIITCDIATTALIRITSTLGQVIYQKQQQVAAGTNYVSTREFSGYLTSGIYIVSVVMDGQQLTARLIF